MTKERKKNKLSISVIKGRDLPNPLLTLKNKSKSTVKNLAKLANKKVISATTLRFILKLLKDLKKEGSSFYFQFNMNHLLKLTNEMI